MAIEAWNRSTLMHLILLAADRTEPLFAGDPGSWSPAPPLPPSLYDLAARIEETTRHIIGRYAPSKAPPFTRSVPGIAYTDQVSLENAAVDQASADREVFLAALASIGSDDRILQLVPEQARGLLRHLRALVQRVPEETTE
jgi:hypothetical protein